MGRMGSRRGPAHPWLALGAAFRILAPLTVPLFSLRLGQEDIGVTPTSTTERQAYDLITRGFGVGYNGPLLIAMRARPAGQTRAPSTRGSTTRRPRCKPSSRRNRGG